MHSLVSCSAHRDFRHSRKKQVREASVLHFSQQSLLAALWSSLSERPDCLSLSGNTAYLTVLHLPCWRRRSSAVLLSHSDIGSRQMQLKRRRRPPFLDAAGRGWYNRHRPGTGSMHSDVPLVFSGRSSLMASGLSQGSGAVFSRHTSLANGPSRPPASSRLP